MPNVTIYPYQEILEFIGTDKLVEGVRFKSTGKDATEQHIRCDGVFEYIGLKPSTEVFAGLGILNEMGFIEVDDEMRTAVKGLYAAGDVRPKKLRQVVTACADGAIAAITASKYVDSII
jgi:thioredoxin reductase (NADPH)